MARIVIRGHEGITNISALISTGAKGDPGVGGGGAVSSVNAATGAVVLDQDDIGDGTTYKQYSATEKTKLSGIATGATANQTDAYLLSLTNATDDLPVANMPSSIVLSVVVPSGGPAPARPDNDSNRVVIWLVQDIADAPAKVTSGTAGRYVNDIVAVVVT